VSYPAAECVSQLRLTHSRNEDHPGFEGHVALQTVTPETAWDNISAGVSNRAVQSIDGSAWKGAVMAWKSDQDPYIITRDLADTAVLLILMPSILVDAIIQMISCVLHNPLVFATLALAASGSLSLSSRVFTEVFQNFRITTATTLLLHDLDAYRKLK
jgi:hypothetical protein